VSPHYDSVVVIGLLRQSYFIGTKREFAAVSPSSCALGLSILYHSGKSGISFVLIKNMMNLM